MRHKKTFSKGNTRSSPANGVPFGFGVHKPIYKRGRDRDEGLPERGMIRIYEDPTPIALGWTVAAASRLAYAAVEAARRRGAHDLDEKRSIALCAIIGELHEHDVDPGVSRLMRAAEAAIEHESNRDWSNRGYNTNIWKYDRVFQKGFQPYWRTGARTPLEDAVVERIGCRQVFAVLSERQQQTLHALAVSDGDPKTAALLLGIKANSVAGNLRNARDAFLVLWHEHETPPAINWRRGRTNTYSPEAAAARPEIARRAVRVREERRAALTQATGSETA
jgi:hypothetical protein